MGVCTTFHKSSMVVAMTDCEVRSVSSHSVAILGEDFECVHILDVV